MKKVIAGVAVAGAMAISMGLGSIPAHAGSDDQKVEFCHSNNGSKGFSFVDTSISAVVDVKTGLPKGHGVDTKDIIPAFNWINDGVRYYFDGLNLDKLGYIDSKNKSCSSDAPDLVSVTPNAPTYIPSSCPTPATSPRFGRVDTSNPGEGVESVEVTQSADNSKWFVEYKLKADTPDVNYEWADGEDGKFSFNATDLHEDPLWVVDSRTKEAGCELSDTGASQDLLLYGGIGVGVLAAGAGAVYFTRRKA